MEVCLIIMAIIMIAMAGLIVFLTYSLKTVQENQLAQSESILSIINIIKTLRDQVDCLAKSEIQRAKKEMDAKLKNKKKREE